MWLCGPRGPSDVHASTHRHTVPPVVTTRTWAAHTHLLYSPERDVGFVGVASPARQPRWRVGGWEVCEAVVVFGRGGGGQHGSGGRLQIRQKQTTGIQQLQFGTAILLSRSPFFAGKTPVKPFLLNLSSDKLGTNKRGNLGVGNFCSMAFGYLHVCIALAVAKVMATAGAEWASEPHWQTMPVRHRHTHHPHTVPTHTVALLCAITHTQHLVGTATIPTCMIHTHTYSHCCATPTPYFSRTTPLLCTSPPWALRWRRT